MKANIHPEYNEVTVIRTDGTEFKTRSTYTKGDSIRLDIDPLNHPAWTGGTGRALETGRVAKFRNRYVSMAGSQEAKKDTKK